MHPLSFLYPAILTLLTLSPTSIHAAKVPKDAILLSQVKSLTLRNNAQTSHRRVAAVPQLSCTGPGCRYYEVDVMRCTNTGSSYGSEEIEWSCTAEIPEEFKLGSTDVQCEGYSSRDDPYVLKGSCGVEYRLLLTSKGEEKYGKGTPGYKSPSDSPSEGWEAGSILFMLLFVGVLFWIIYSACTALPTNPNAAPRAARRNNGGWGGGGGGGWGGWGGGNDDPPPPYPGTGSKPSGSQDSWRPGFWTGAGLGAGAGYLAGRGRGNQNREREPLFGNGRQDNGGWFGGGNNNNGGYTQPSRSNSNGSSSSARHESTGFGSTSRR